MQGIENVPLWKPGRTSGYHGYTQSHVVGEIFRRVTGKTMGTIFAGRNRALEVRAEVFNATNTPFFGAPNTTVGAAAFGTITTAGDPRVIQLASNSCSRTL